MTQRVKDLIDYAKRFTAIPYKWSGNHPCEGLDCSGFMCILLRREGILSWNEDLSSRAIFQRLREEHGTSEVKPGSFLFFGRDRITHIAMAVSETHMIEAGGGGKDTVTLKRAVERRAFIREMPIASRSDFREACFVLD